MFNLKKNMGTIDRSLRFLAGSTLLTIGPLTDLVPTDIFSNVILTCMALVALSSALVSYCVLYELTGFDTCAKSD
jgi:hypothetical protein